MGDQWKDQDVRDGESEQVRSRAMDEDVDEFDEITEDQDDEEDIDDQDDSSF
jgi:hypothetical protein